MHVLKLIYINLQTYNSRSEEIHIYTVVVMQVNQTIDLSYAHMHSTFLSVVFFGALY